MNDQYRNKEQVNIPFRMIGVMSEIRRTLGGVFIKVGEIIDWRKILFAIELECGVSFSTWIEERVFEVVHSLIFDRGAHELRLLGLHGIEVVILHVRPTSHTPYTSSCFYLFYYYFFLKERMIRSTILWKTLNFYNSLF